MMSFILFFPILTKVGNVFAVPTTVGEVTIKVIEDIVEGEQELTNDIFQDFDKVDCLFFQKENSIGNCKSTEWGILLLLVINGLIYSIIIKFIYWLCNKCCCHCTKSNDEDIEEITLEDYKKLEQEFLEVKEKKSELENSNLQLLEILNELKNHEMHKN